MKRDVQIGWLLLLAMGWGAAAGDAHAALLSGGLPDPTHNSNSMLLWLKADTGFTNNGVQADWLDQSTYGRHVRQTTASNLPTYSAAGLNATHPAILFDGNDFLTFAAAGTTGPTGQQSAFIVYKDGSTAQYATPIGSTYPVGLNKGSYHGEASSNNLFSGVHTDPATLNGDNFRNGVDIGTGTTTPRLGTANNGWSVDSHIATTPLTQQVTTIGADGFSPAMRAINGGIAEVLLYNYALSAPEREQIESYFNTKYDLNFVAPPPVPTPGVVIADAAGDWVASDGSTAASVVGGTAAGWSYLRSNLASGGTEIALVPSANTGEVGGPGFASNNGTGTRMPAIVGDNANGGDFELFPSGNPNAPVVGTDLLMHAGIYGSTPPPDGIGEFLIARYTIQPSDLTLSSLIAIEGSFRNMITTGNSIDVSVFHNLTELFSAAGDDPLGTDGNLTTLSMADGSFSILGLNVAVGDALSFVVGTNGDIGSDETAFRVTITNVEAVPEPSSLALALCGAVGLGLCAARRARRRA